MKYIILTILSLLAHLVGVAQPPEVIYQLVPSGTGGAPFLRRWIYIDGDEFNESELDTDRWLDEYPWARNLLGNREQQYYMPNQENIEFHNGIMKFKAEKTPIFARTVPYLDDWAVLSDGNQNFRPFLYRSGMIFSKTKYKNGLFWARIKTSSGRGTWPAFWLYGGNPNEEFDILEGKGERPFEYHVAVHFEGDNDASPPTGFWLNTSTNITTSFNNYFGEWHPNVVFWQFNNSNAGGYLVNLNQYANIILNLAIAGWCCDLCEPETPFCPGPHVDTYFPQYMETDFVRVYDVFDCETDKTVCSHTQPLSTSESITARRLTIGGVGCTSIVFPEQRLTLTASESITLFPGFDSRKSSFFKSQIVNCTEPDGLSENQFTLFESNKLTEAINLPKVSEFSIENLYDSVIYRPHNNNIELIYPNPVELGGYFQINNLPPCKDKIRLVTIIDVTGNVVNQQKIQCSDNERMSTENLNRGIYIVEVHTSGNQITKAKLIIE